MEFLVIGHVKDADVGVQPGDAPDVQPFSFALKLLGVGFLTGFDRIGLGFGQRRRDIDGHFNFEQHRDVLLVARVITQFVEVNLYVQPRPLRQRNQPLSEVERRDHDVVFKQ